jgi:hypothetical protein
MNAITSIYLRFIETSYDADYICDAFYCNDIATVSKITLIPFTHDNKTFYSAYIDIAVWHETEKAYKFIMSLRNPHNETRFEHEEDAWWVAEINKIPEMTSSVAMACYTSINYLIYNEEAEMEAAQEELFIIQSIQHLTEDPDWKSIATDIDFMRDYNNCTSAIYL